MALCHPIDKFPTNRLPPSRCHVTPALSTSVVRRLWGEVNALRRVVVFDLYWKRDLSFQRVIQIFYSNFSKFKFKLVLLRNEWNLNEIFVILSKFKLIECRLWNVDDIFVKGTDFFLFVSFFFSEQCQEEGGGVEEGWMNESITSLGLCSLLLLFIAQRAERGRKCPVGLGSIHSLCWGQHFIRKLKFHVFVSLLFFKILKLILLNFFEFLQIF